MLQWLTPFLAARYVYAILHQQVLRDVNGSYYLAVYSARLFRALPNAETAREFLGDEDKAVDFYANNATQSAEFAGFSWGEPVMDLAYKDSTSGWSRTPDERTRNQIEKVLAVQSSDFWTDSHFMMGLVNAAVVNWRGENLIAWKTTLRDNSYIKIGWVGPKLSAVSRHKVYLGISFGSDLQALPGGSLWALPQGGTLYDPRLLALSNGDLVVTYCVPNGNLRDEQYQQGRMLIRVNKSALPGATRGGDNASVLRAEIIDNKVFRIEGVQKNWCPFEHNNTLMYLQSLNPLHVVKPEFDEATTDKFSVGVSTVSRRGHVNMTWRADYGWPLRGGTPAIKIPGLYLTLFHTVSRFQMPYKIKTYYMGALTFCDEYPFNIHSVSAAPIVKKRFYEGAWVKNNLDYVVFPAGLVLDSDGEHVWVSMGAQDASSWMIKLELHGLLKSLDVVGSCGGSLITSR